MTDTRELVELTVTTSTASQRARHEGLLDLVSPIERGQSVELDEPPVR